MKRIITTLLVLATFTASRAQQPGKNDGLMYGVPAPAVSCGGISNTVWDGKPLQGVAAGIPAEAMSAPGQRYIDSIKDEKLRIKEAIEIAKGMYNKTTSVHPVMGTNFAANTFNGSTPSDNSVAISDSGYIVSVNNASISFYKDNGTLLFTNLIKNWMPFGGTTVSNPVVLYDTRAGRFIFVCQQSPIIDTGKIYICFSRSYNPAASVGWYCYALRGNPAGGDGFDFPRIAVNDSELFITGNLYGSPGTSSTYFDKPIIHQIDKLAGYAGTSMSSIYYPYIVANPFSLLPISNGQTAGITTGMYLVNTTSSGGSSIGLYKITGNWCCAPSMSYTTVSTSSYAVPANSHQLSTSGLLNVGDCRALSGFMLGNTIHFAFNADAGSGYCGINYNRLNVTTNTNVSSMFGQSGFDYAYPSVVSYATTATNPSVIVGFGSSGASIYPEIRAVNCDSAMSWSATTLVKASPSYVGGTSGVAKWGDYTGTSRRHNSAAPSVWMNGMFGNAAHNWDTWVAEIHDAISTPCPTPTGLYVNGITVTTAVLHWAAVGGAINYNIQYRPSAGGTWSTATSTTTSKTITLLNYSTNYEFQVQAVCSDSSTGSFSLSDTFTTHNPPAAINELSHGNTAKVYPNPVTGNFSVEFSLSQPAELNIAIADITGRVVKQLYNGMADAGSSVLSFDKANLAKGVYVLAITADSKLIRNEKIVVVE